MLKYSYDCSVASTCTPFMYPRTTSVQQHVHGKEDGKDCRTQTREDYSTTAKRKDKHYTFRKLMGYVVRCHCYVVC